ncbi:MAG: hypothetical protein J2P46_03025 [Zavarzinella sp.]|nr:hypothetical protein [Zavarzinella sp.]
MFRRIAMSFTLAVLAVPLAAQDRPKADGTVVTGKLFSYDKDRKTVTIAPLQGDGKSATYQMEKGTEIFIDGRRGAITAIPDNHPVQVTLNPDHTVVLRLAAEGPTQKRKILGVIRDQLTLQLDRGTDTEEVPVARDAVIVVNGKDAKFEDLQAGDTATIRFAIDRKTIRGIQVGLPKPEPGKLPVKD